MPPKQSPIYILLADDDKDDRFFFEKALEELVRATQLKTVSDGASLMDFLGKNTKELPEVLFLDLNMPRKNGAECLKEIKADKHLKKIPVVIYSTSLSEEGADKLYEDGAHYYLHKRSLGELPQGIEQVLTLLDKNPAKPSRDGFIVGVPGK